MLRPLLIIGLGGSGGKTIRSMKQALERRFASERYTGGIPAAWQFLQIDTTYDGETFPAPMLPRSSVHQVVPNGATFYSVRDSIMRKGTVREQQEMLAGWGVHDSSITVADGAGQVRAIGRQIGVADSAEILDTLKNSISSMKAPNAAAELGQLGRAFGHSTVENIPQALIITSLGGGTGAGLAFDVAELLKRATSEKWTNQTISFLYTSEVFQSLNNAGRDIAKNSLGCMNELIASKWVPISDRTELLYQKLGVVASANQESIGYGPAGNILIGARNKSGTDISQGVDGAGMDEVFLTVGEALAGTLVDKSISEWLFQKAFVNIIQTWSSIDKSGLAPENAQNPTLAAAGIGFGQLNLGTDRIVDYVADALTREQVKTLLFPDLSPDVLKDGVPVTKIVDDKAESVWIHFLPKSGLNEKGTNNQIIEALEPKDWRAEAKQFAGSLVQKSVSDSAMPLGKFVNSVWSEWETESETALMGIKNKINKCAQEWVPDIQNRFNSQIAQELTQTGYFVVMNLVDRLVSELKLHVLPELKREHQDLGAAIQGFNQGAFAERVRVVSDGLTGVTRANGAFLNRVMADLTSVMERKIQSHIFDLAASLVDDMLKLYFEPLRKLLVDSRYELQKQQRDSLLPDGSKNPFPEFPEWGAARIAERYKPRTIERILIEPLEFEDLYELYAGRDAEGSQPFQKSVTYSLRGEVLNPAPGVINQQNLIEVDVPWSTSVRDAMANTGANQSTFKAQIHTGLLDLAERNRKWLKNQDTSFGKFTDMTINEFVTDQTQKPEERDKREQKFVKEFGALLSLAQPLVLLNGSGMQYVTNVKNAAPATGVMMESSKIPFDPQSTVGQGCIQVLRQNGQNITAPNFIQDWFSPASNEKSLVAATATEASLPAWAFESLTEPILEQKGNSVNGVGEWKQFWKERRTRPLVEAVPFESEIRKSIITGWFIASMFGLTKVETLSVGRSAQVWNPTLQVPDWSSSPSPMLQTHLEDNKNNNWILPQLLTSAGLALAEFGKTGDMTHLRIYQFLKYLGREVTTSIPGRDKWDGNGTGDLLPTGIQNKCNFLQSWIIDGVLPAESHDLHPVLAQNLHDHSNRQVALNETLNTWKAEYEKAWKSYENESWKDLPETWELRDDIDQALADLSQFTLGLQAQKQGPSI